MDTAVFGSFSITSFIDLYHSHKSSWHDGCILIELSQGEDGHNQILTYSSDIDTFKRKCNTTYLFGVLYDTNSQHEFVVYVDEKNNNEIIVDESFKERKKLKNYSLNINSAIIEIVTTEREHIYVDDYLSISSTPLNNFDAIDPNVEYRLDIHEVSWKSFGVAGGYGSRNKIKKLLYPRYNKKQQVEKYD